MNLQDISLRIENPALLSSLDVPILLNLTKKYPYSQLLSILYLKALAKDQALELEEEVVKHAYKITDRGRLYEILNEKEEIEIVKEIFSDDKINDTNSIQNSINVSEIIDIEEKEAITTTYENPVENSIHTKTDKQSEHTLDIDVISSAISGVFEKEFEPKRLKETEQFDNNTKSENIDLSFKNIQPTEFPFKESKQRFTSWLKAGTTEKPLNKSEKVEQIIDTFIQEDPKISQPKKEFYSPIKQAKKSLESESIQYTETLANILGIQGNYPKAILAYEQL